MSDAPTPLEASGADSTPAPTPAPDPHSGAPEAPRRKRPWTILGRLTAAVREQNWFAVVLELAIVVLGVLIAFQVTAWGQERQDVVREQAYLRQVLGDLAETEETLLRVDSLSQESIRAGMTLQRAFHLPQRPPQDSLYAWWQTSLGMHSARPVVGTAEARVSSGDITLVRNDSLRSSIVSYVENVKEQNRYYGDMSDWWHANMWQLRSSISPSDLYMRPDDSPQVRDSLGSLAWWPIPSGPRLEPFPGDLGSLLTDRAVYHNVDMMTLVQYLYQYWRAGLLERTRSLRQQVEAELNR